MSGLAEIWVYLAQEPLAALTATLLAWLAAVRLHHWCGRHPLANPVLIAVALLAGGLLASGVAYRDYFAGAQFVHFLLGPATVALAVPLHRQFALVRQSAVAAVASVVLGGAFAAAAGVAIALALGAAPEVTASLAPRSVTTPVAMGLNALATALLLPLLWALFAG
ncbi:LrgB family protein [Falsiroseomonas sp.]|uniref:LrgB family protein n=1 Tax=Falsiroseomonas sp. TaxID=2870721 RepID=UPI0035677F39